MANKVNHNHTYATRAVISLRPQVMSVVFQKYSEYTDESTAKVGITLQYNPLNDLRYNVDKHQQSFATVKKRKDFQCPMINIKLKLIHVNYA